MAATTATALSVTGCSASLAEIIPTGSAGSLGSTGATEQPGTNAAAALATLETIPVKGRAPKTGYSRDQFGQAWTDDVTVEFGHNGCDTRNDILARDLTDIVYKQGTKQCVVLSGTLADPYTGKTIKFVRGQDTSTAVQIDHVVALSDAWQKGAQQLSPEERRNLANDPRNLIPVDGPTNGQKSDSDAASWLPPNKAYRCTYVSQQITVKSIYRLWVTQAEKGAMQKILATC
ncbi:HNH endonuclease (plasmid) [Rhodococcus sp. H-CA8f]|uniref:HNH endonuclease family protein n=1 Tax=Rhodococcus sp. H-CA8f TaxID=1727214 RepID=UPI000BE3F42A|nr:HNH endonuclease [Rhodococcus sp. H-CA8f]